MQERWPRSISSFCFRAGKSAATSPPRLSKKAGVRPPSTAWSITSMPTPPRNAATVATTSTTWSPSTKLSPRATLKNFSNDTATESSRRHLHNLSKCHLDNSFLFPRPRPDDVQQSAGNHQPDEIGAGAAFLHRLRFPGEAEHTRPSQTACGRCLFDRPRKRPANYSKALKAAHPDAPAIIPDTALVDFLNLPQKHTEKRFRKAR